ncbi:hypothetical protein [Marinobacter sp. F4206]|uniref:hypothetical protein n=1 Tax=Marinobacter sp. F4206 TaxID=2861777 RepID=UPI001C5E0F76|nr:hypothetical protein [Marinobacter sp. F4206]MBW4935565.1 hypothetical protein [Marinobacter sp. F4206]
MGDMDVFSRPVRAGFLLVVILFQGCSTHSHERTAHQMKVNRDMANSWREHGDEKVARSFESRNRKLAEERTDNYGFVDFLIDILIDG